MIDDDNMILYCTMYRRDSHDAQITPESGVQIQICNISIIKRSMSCCMHERVIWMSDGRLTIAPRQEDIRERWQAVS